MNVKDTRWCTAQDPRLSRDGTTEFLDVLALNPRIEVIKRERWDGKVDQCNAALERFQDPGVLLQADADEIWTADQLRTIVQVFDDDMTLGSMCFDCRYFVGPNVVTTDHADWWRAWRYMPGDRFVTHEPPRMSVNRGRAEGRVWTARLGLVFDHFSWALPQHVAYKEVFYGQRYAGALRGWERLQRHREFPAPIKAFFPWSDPKTSVDRLFDS